MLGLKMNFIRKKRQALPLKSLTWSDYKDIAAELDMRHCNIDIMTLHRSTLITMIEDIPRFDGKGTKPDPYTLDDIRFEWFFLRKGSEDSIIYNYLEMDNRN